MIHLRPRPVRITLLLLAALVVPLGSLQAAPLASYLPSGVDYLVAADINAYEVLRHNTLLIEDGALASLEERFTNG